MRISDWSSDVCSSDLLTASLAGAGGNLGADYAHSDHDDPCPGNQIFGKMVCIVLGPEMMDVWRICSGQGQPPRCPACRQQYPVGPDAVTILQGYGTSCQVQAFGAQAKVQVDTIFTVPCLDRKSTRLNSSH